MTFIISIKGTELENMTNNDDDGYKFVLILEYMSHDVFDYS